MILRLLRGRRWVPLAVLGGGAAAHAGMWAGVMPCPKISMSACVVTAAAIVGGGSLAAIVVRAARLGRAAARDLAALPRARLPGLARAAAVRAGARRVTCVQGSQPAAFCAGLWRPRVYLTDTAARVLGLAELDAVLAHETAHARRRDPLRRLAARAAADVLFYLPLARWWSGRQIERAELAADRAAITHAGRSAVAAALLSIATPAQHHRTGAPATVLAYGGAIDARIAQLSGEAIAAQRPRAKPVILSLAGLVLIVSLAMCISQATLRI
jgi:Zn-dependent protease with chaperone function